ncbi:MAG TPA: class I SAM-dependent methyltransferase, partial [Micromonosporaceae bacterium]|nr:class I SAM-dependent methyltransferase [Micromonosporaceae bacterium]
MRPARDVRRGSPRAARYGTVAEIPTRGAIRVLTSAPPPTATPPSPAAFCQAEANRTPQSPIVLLTLLQGATTLPYLDEQVTGVMLCYSTIHTPPGGQARLFAEAARVLRPAGHPLVGFRPAK